MTVTGITGVGAIDGVVDDGFVLVFAFVVGTAGVAVGFGVLEEVEGSLTRVFLGVVAGVILDSTSSSSNFLRLIDRLDDRRVFCGDSSMPLKMGVA